MLLVGSSKFTRFQNGVDPSVLTDDSEYATGREYDSGNEDYEDLEVSEEILLPDDEEDPQFDLRPSPLEEDDEEILYRQMAYPPLPEYVPPYLDYPSSSTTTTKYVSKKKDARMHPRERLGVLTPMEEVTEPPSSGGTEASGAHRSRNRQKTDRLKTKNKPDASKRKDIESNISEDQQKSILKSKSPVGSPDRRVKFVGAGSATQSDRSVSPTESQTSEEYSSAADTARKLANVQRVDGNNEAIQEVEEEGEEGGDQEFKSSQNDTNLTPTMEQLQKVETWQLGNDVSNQEPPLTKIDAEFASILDDIIAELHSWDRLAGTGASITEINASRQDHLANVSSQLTSYLGQVHPSTVMSNLPQLIPLITTLLSLTEINFRAQLSSLNAVNVFSERLKDCKTQTGLKILPYADLTWLVRTLCDISSESSRSVLKSVGTASLASLVKAAGPEMVTEPILLILMGNDEKVPKRPEGSGNIVTTGIPGGPPKTKATALDTLTFALLTFPRDAFDLDVVARLACHCLLHSKRRVRQAALECLAVVAHSLTPSVAVPLFRKFISEEEDAIRSDNDRINSLNTEARPPPAPPSPSKLVELANHYDSELDIDPRILYNGPPSRIPVPVRVLEAQQKNQAEANTTQKPQVSTSPLKTNKGPTPTSAVAARISRHILPSPNLEELVEYGVKIPANCQILSRQSLKVGGQEESCDEGERVTGDASSSGRGNKRVPRERHSSGGESCGSVSNIEYSLLELEPVLNTHGGSGVSRRKGGRHGQPSSDFTMAADVLWILDGTGAVKKCDPAAMLPKDLKILAPGPSKRNNNVGTASENESDFSSSIASSQNTKTLGGNSDLNMKRITSNTASDLLQDAFVQEPVIGRYYYPPTSHIVSPRSTLISSDPLSSRYSSKSSYNLLPNKYSVLRNNNQYRGGRGGGHDLVSPHALLPGAYDNPFAYSNGYSVDSDTSASGNWHSDLGSLSKINLKPKPLEPLENLRGKYFESAKINESRRSDSQQSGSTGEEESEPEHVKTEPNLKPSRTIAATPQRNKNVNENSRKPPIAPRPTPQVSTSINTNNANKGVSGGRINGLGSNSRDELSVRRQTEMLVHANREYQVYHSHVEMGTVGSGFPSTTVVKRVDVDSAGSNHTRDSGVSVGSVGGSKTPPSAHNTPPTQHRSPSPGQPISSAQQRAKASNATRNQLSRNWQSTPDVPLVLEVGSERNASIDVQRNRSGSSSSSRNRLQNPKPVQVSASDENMPVHRKPVLARRGQSMTRTPGGSIHPDESSLPRIQYTGQSRDNSRTRGRNGSGSRDPFDDDNDDYRQQNSHPIRVDTSPSHKSTLSPTPIRNSVSTGNLAHDTEVVVRSRIPPSKSTYFETGGGGASVTSRTSRREGPFGDVEYIMGHQESTTLPSRRNPVSKATGRIVPTKVYKGSFREINSRKASNGSIRNEVFPSDMKPVTSPKHALPLALGQLESADWETNVDGFRQLVRMIRFDPDFIRNDLHNINITGVKHLSNLRSQVCRAAILCFEELFTHLGRSMEMDCEKIAEKLLDKSADTNKFIREASSRALEAMMINLTPLKGLTCLDLFGTRHRNPVVRCTASKLTAKLVDTVGTERCLGELSERLLPMLCKLLQEGSLETRTSAKTAMSTLMTHPSFNNLLKRYVPTDVLRHSQKNIDALQKF